MNKPIMNSNQNFGNKPDTKLLWPAPAYFINSINWIALWAKPKQQAQRCLIRVTYNVDMATLQEHALWSILLNK